MFKEKNLKSKQLNINKVKVFSLEFWNSISTIILAIAAVLQMFFTYHAFDQTKQTIEISKVAQRARIFISDLKFVNISNPKSPTFKVICKVSNVGLTTAFFESREFVFLDKSLPQNPDYTSNIQPVNYILYPQQSFYLSGSNVNKWQFKNFNEIILGYRPLYLIGYIKYQDEFGDKHTYRIAAKYRIDGNSSVVIKPGYNTEINDN